MRVASLLLTIGLLLATSPLAAAQQEASGGGDDTKVKGLFPNPASDVQRDWQELFTTVFWIALIVFVIVEGLLLYAIIRFRRRRHGPQEGPHIHGNTKMEIAWTIAPTLVMAYLLVISLEGMAKLEDPEEPPEFYVTVTGSQWSWQFTYPDRKSSSTLFIEEGHVVGLNLTSNDVIHAFSIPELGVMKDAEPGRFTHAWFKADKPGTYRSICRELCGITGHGKMWADVVIFPDGQWPLPYGDQTPQPATNATNQTALVAPEGYTRFNVTLGPGLTINPPTMEFEPGDKIFFVVTNRDTAPHNFYFGPFDPDEEKAGAVQASKDLGPGETTSFQYDVPAEPVYFDTWCNIAGHKAGGMEGVLDAGGTPGTSREVQLPVDRPMFTILFLVLTLVVVVVIVALVKTRQPL